MKMANHDRRKILMRRLVLKNSAFLIVLRKLVDSDGRHGFTSLCRAHVS